MNNEQILNLLNTGKLTPGELTEVLRAGQKDIEENSAYFGPTTPFDACTRQVLGYGIWTRSNNKFYNWLLPTLIPEQRALNFYVMDWRPQLEVTPNTSNDWCALNDFTAAPLHGCRIDYCFDPNRYYWDGRQILTPAELQEVCFRIDPIMFGGQRITNQDFLEQFLMFARQMTTMQRSLILDNSDDAFEEDGIAAWFTNFATRHPELTGDCLDELGPQTISLAGDACADFPATLYETIWALEHKVQMLVGGPTVPESYWVLLMNPLDKRCLIECQSCVLLCNSPIVLSPELATPAGRAVFQNDYNNRSTGGLYGNGYVELKDGRKISIIEDWTLPQGTFYLLMKGWTGGENGGNINGMRLAVNNWSEWVAMRNRKLARGTVITPLGDGAMIYIVSDEGVCVKEELRWNWRLFSNAPWGQTRFTNFTCTIADPAFGPLPELTGAVPCDQVPVVVQ